MELARSLGKPIVSFAAVITLLLLGSICSANLTGSYMTTQPTWIAYLRLTESGNKLTGYIQYVYALGSGATTTKRADVHGTVSGTAVSLKLDSFLGYGGKEADGELKKGQLVLEFPTDTGKIEQFSFAPTTTAGWNRAVTAFQSQTSRSARKKQINDQGGIALLTIYDAQQTMARRLQDLNAARKQVPLAQSEVTQCTEDLKQIEARIAKAENEAVTSEDRAAVGLLRAQAGEARARLSTAQFHLNTANHDMTSALGGIDKEKARIQQNVAQVTALLVEARRLGEPTTEMPNIGKYMGQVSVPKAPVRLWARETSDIVRELQDGAYVGIINFDGSQALVILADGKRGYTAKSNLRLLTMNQIGRTIMGQLGTVTVLEAPITQERDPASKLLTMAKRDTYLCITKVESDYYCVLMANGSRGWIKRQNVQLLNYQVVSDGDGNFKLPQVHR